MQRASGVMLHISSLPSLYGFGSLGKEAFDFVDFLYESGFKYWQILPLNPTNESGSPFQSYSVFAGNISLLDLIPFLTEEEKKSFLKDSKKFCVENKTSSSFAFCNQIDFEMVYYTKIKYLKNVFERNINKTNLETFKKQHSFWLEDYCLFCVLKDIYSTSYWKFPKGLSNYNKAEILKFKKEHKTEIEFYCFIQYLFFTQWQELKQYANNKNIKIFGDLAFYPAGDSCDVWANRDDFCFDEYDAPKGIAGVPPDYFSKDGQVWGSPVYNVENMKNNGYKFWLNRFKHAKLFFDVVRLDHFRGFEAFWVVKNYKATSAKNGKWVKGLGLEFFETLKNKNIPTFVAEDLGIITKDVKNLIDKLGIAGMKVFQFAFDGNAKNPYFPHNYTENCVAYLGTHDNNTFIGFLENEVSPKTLKEIKNYLGQAEDASNKQVLDMAFSVLLNSRADIVVLTMQDILCLDGNYRMNTPSTINNNWCFRLNYNYNSKELKRFLLNLNISANRT